VIPITCRELVELVTDYLEDALPAAERTRFEAHLADCEHCTEYLAQMRTTVAVLGRLPADSLPDAARDRLLAAFRDWKQGAGRPD
jgi:anti-sigma factor RsiW